MSRTFTSLAARAGAIAALVLGLAGAAAAQQAQPLPNDLGALRRLVEARRASYLVAVQARVEAQDRHSTLREQRIGLLDDQRKLEAEAPGFFRDRKLNSIRSEMARVSGDEAEAFHRLQDQRGNEVVRRFDLIRSLEAFVVRLLEVAKRARDADRALDEKQLAEEALQAAREADNLWARVEHARVEELPHEDPTKVEDGRLEGLIATYREYSDRAQARATELLPDRDALARRARKIEELIERGYAAPDLPQRLERAREHLGRVAGVVDRELRRRDDYEKRVEEMEKERANRALRRGAAGPEVPR